MSVQTYNHSVGFADSSIKARLLNFAQTKASPVQGEGDHVSGGRVVKILCKAPKAAVQRRCGDRVSGGRVVKTASFQGKSAKNHIL